MDANLDKVKNNVLPGSVAFKLYDTYGFPLDLTADILRNKNIKIDNVSFNANLFRDVLVANKECESATLEVSSGGLARINFKIDEYDATYYLVAEQDV